MREVRDDDESLQICLPALPACACIAGSEVCLCVRGFVYFWAADAVFYIYVRVFVPIFFFSSSSSLWCDVLMITIAIP